MAEQWYEVANDALLKTGTQLITSLDQNITAARLCKARLPKSLAIILRRYPWKCVMKTVALPLLSGAPADPTCKFAYQLPVDWLRIWKYVPGTNPNSGINYGSNFVVRGNQIWSNDCNPILTYVYNPYPGSVGPSPIDALCLEAIACQLGVDVSYQITQSMAVKQSIQQELKVAIQAAKTADSMESPEVYDFQASEFLTARFAGTGYMGVNNPGFPAAG